MMNIYIYTYIYTCIYMYIYIYDITWIDLLVRWGPKNDFKLRGLFFSRPWSISDSNPRKGQFPIVVWSQLVRAYVRLHLGNSINLKIVEFEAAKRSCLFLESLPLTNPGSLFNLEWKTMVYLWTGPCGSMILRRGNPQQERRCLAARRCPAVMAMLVYHGLSTH